MNTLDQYRQKASAVLKQGAPLVAYDTAAEGLRHYPGDPRLRQLLALSLARSGASRQASELLRALVEEGHADEESVGMLARTHKDLATTGEEPRARQHHLEQAFQCYAHAHRLSGGYWSGINAGTMALLLGRDDDAVAYARQVSEICLGLWTAGSEQSDAYWILATLGEAALLMRDVPAAERWYRQAASLQSRTYGDLVSTRRNARLILRHQQIDTAAIDACFRIPRVGVFAGHLIDRPDRPSPRFPPTSEAAVRRELDGLLRRYDVGFGYSSAASGGDILFLEALRACDAELHIVLPYNREQFLKDSVDVVPGGDWPARFHELLDGAAQVVIASEQRMLSGAMSYEYGFLLLDGMAARRADELDTELVCFAVWDGRSGDGPGGTASAVAHWRRAGRHVEIVPPSGAPPSVVPIHVQPADANSSDRPERSEGSDAQLVGLMFADVAGFSKLTEEEVPRFVEHYLGRVAQVVAEQKDPPLYSNTWGDGLYFVFRDIGETARFALRLSEVIRGTDWTQHGLPATLGLRVAVHAGPVYACTDPVTTRRNYLGAHVSHAARIEPVTPAGEVYGSGAFVAVARSLQVRHLAATYVGQTPLAKGYGTFPMYVLRRADGA